MNDKNTEPKLVKNVIITMPRKHKIKTPEYNERGKIPIIDQSTNFIAGYIDDPSLAYDDTLPVIVFGDHTCIFKYVNFQFAVGADGTQLIRPRDEGQFDIRYLYYALRCVPLMQFGYQRHFKYLKSAEILWRPLDEQIKIASVLSLYDDLIETNIRRNIQLSQVRDLLAPRLISGEMNVSELDIDITEEVA